MLAGTLCPPVPAAHRVGVVHISLYIIHFSLPYCKKSRRFLGPTLQKRSETAGWFAAGIPPGSSGLRIMQPFCLCSRMHPRSILWNRLGKDFGQAAFVTTYWLHEKKGVDRLRETINRLAVEIVIRITGRNYPESPCAKLRPRSSGNGISSISEGMQPSSCRLREA